MMLDYITSDEIHDHHIHVMGSNVVDATAFQFTVGYINRREHTLFVRCMPASDYHDYTTTYDNTFMVARSIGTTSRVLWLL